MTGALEALLVLAVWAGASAAILVGLPLAATAGAALAAAAAAVLLGLHGGALAAALLGAGGVLAAVWLRPPSAPRPVPLPPGSAPGLTLCVVIGVLAVWIGGGVLAGPGGAPGRTAALVLIGLGTSRLVSGSDPPRLPRAALLLGLGLGLVAGVEPQAVALRGPVIGLAAAGVVGAALTFGGSALPRGTPWVWAAAAAGLILVALSPSLAVLALVPLLLLFAPLRAGGDPFCMRSAALASGLLGVAALAAARAGGDRVEALAGLTAALAVAAAAGLLPHLMELEDSDAARAAFLRRALVAPALVLAVAAQVQASLAPVPLQIFGGTLLGLGALNVLVGLVAGFPDDRLQAWRAAYLAEWGLVLLGLGLRNPTGLAAAYLLLLALLLLRLPPAAWLRAEAASPRPARARTVMLALALAGGAPFLGFAGRLLLLRGTTALAWPLALAVGVALAAWLPAAWRLAGDLRPRGRPSDLAQLAGLVATAALGVYPAAVLRPVGLG